MDDDMQPCEDMQPCVDLQQVSMYSEFVEEVLARASTLQYGLTLLPFVSGSFPLLRNPIRRVRIRL